MTDAAALAVPPDPRVGEESPTEFKCDECHRRFVITCTPEEASNINRFHIQCEACWHKAEDAEAEARLTRMPLWAHPDSLGF